jgi:hypothetical protein
MNMAPAAGMSSSKGLERHAGKTGDNGWAIGQFQPK